MTKQMTTTEKIEIEVSISKDILYQAMGEDIEKISIPELVSRYNQVENFEAMAIARIKQSADHDKGMFIQAIKVKEPNTWKKIVKDEFDIGATRANQLTKFFNDSHSFDSLTKLKENKNERSVSSDSIKLEDLSFPTRERELAEIEGLTSREKVAIHKQLKKEKVPKENIKIIVARAELAAKAMNHTAEAVNNIVEQIHEYELEIRDDGKIHRIDEDEDGKVKVKTNTKKIYTLQEEFDAFSNKIKARTEELWSNPTKAEKIAELGWTEDDQKKLDLFNKMMRGGLKVDPFFEANYELWKASYKEIVKITHPDSGGSEEAQAFMNTIGAEMNKIKAQRKYNAVSEKYEKINKEYKAWVYQQSADIRIELSDVIAAALEKQQGE